MQALPLQISLGSSGLCWLLTAFAWVFQTCWLFFDTVLSELRAPPSGRLVATGPALLPASLMADALRQSLTFRCILCRQRLCRARSHDLCIRGQARPEAGTSWLITRNICDDDGSSDSRNEQTPLLEERRPSLVLELKKLCFSSRFLLFRTIEAYYLG